MNQNTKNLRNGFAVLLMASGLTVSGALLTVNGQDKPEAKPSPTRSNSGGRDPFKKYQPPRPAAPKKSNVVTPPSIQARIEQYKAQKQTAMMARIAAPKPTTAFLLSEVQVVGISRSPRGYAAIVEATPIKLAYVIYPGEKFYDGQLVAIEDNRLVFRRETVFSNGKRERAVELKPLRQANIVDALAATKAAPANTTAVEPEKKPEDNATKPQ
jgi:Tfp pilus assembly protein PilP